MSGVIIAGNMKISKGAGLDWVLKIENCVIGNNVFVAAGSVVTKILGLIHLQKVPTKYARKNWPNFSKSLINKVIEILGTEKLTMLKVLME